MQLTYATQRKIHLENLNQVKIVEIQIPVKSRLKSHVSQAMVYIRLSYQILKYLVQDILITLV